MAAGFIDPNGDIAAGFNQINPGSPTTHYDKIDDAVRQPDTPDESDWIRAVGTSGTQTDEFDMSTLADVDEVTAVTIWVRSLRGAFPPAFTRISIAPGGGAYLSPISVSPGTSPAWQSAAFTGLTWTQEQLDGMKVKLEFGGAGGKFAASWLVYAAYGEVTYSEDAPAGRLHLPPRLDALGGFGQLGFNPVL